MAEQDDVIRKFAERVDAEKRARRDAGTVEAIAAKLGVSEWHVYKVVLSEAEALVWKTHEGPPGKEKLGILVAACVEYVKHYTRGDPPSRWRRALRP